MKRFVFGLSLSSLLVAGLLSGCGGSSSSAALPDPEIRFINLSPDASLDLAVNGTVRVTNLGFLGNSNIFSVKPEEADFDIFETGATVGIDPQIHTFPADTDQLIIAFGKLNFGTETDKRLRFITQQFDRRRPSQTQARVFVFNAMIRTAGESSFPVIFKNPGTNPNVEFAAVDFGQISSRDIDATPQTLVAQRSNTDTEVATVTKNFEGGKIYFMVLSGDESVTTGPNAPTINFLEIQTQ